VEQVQRHEADRGRRRRVLGGGRGCDRDGGGSRDESASQEPTLPHVTRT
jgi:hypothetical protein